MNRDTVGKISVDLAQKPLETTDPIEQANEQLSQYDHNIELCIEKSLKKYDGNFYIVVITKKERLLQNVIRHYFFSRKTCPTPEFDQTVYRYERSSHMIEFLWTLPSKQAYFYLLNNIPTIPADQYDLLQFVVDDAQGKLLAKCKLLNGEVN